MSRCSTRIALALAAACLAGCAGGIYSGGEKSYPANTEVPIAANFKSSTQLKLQAAEHWKRIAYYSASALSKSLRSGGSCIPKHDCPTLYVRRTCETGGCERRACDTAFNRAFYNELATALVGLGYPVSTVPSPNAIVVDMDVQAVRFAHNRPQYRYAGEAIELGPGVWALRDRTSLVDKDGNVAPRTTDFDTNWYRAQFAAGETPRNEIVVTVSALSPERAYVARNTSVYYTADADAAHYFCAPVPARASAADAYPFGVTTWTIPVVGDCSPGRCTDNRGR